jgi:hypothetical protein
MEAESLVITAIMPLHRYQRNGMKQPAGPQAGFADRSGQKPDQKNMPFIPVRYCK